MAMSTGRVSLPTSIPGPIGGWNRRDSVADMDEKDAIQLVNVWPSTSDVMLRKGWTEHATDLPNQVESLLPYAAPSGTDELFAASGGGIYDVTSSGAVGAAAVSGQSNDRWQSVNFVNSSGTAYLCCFNGEDSPQYYNGSSWITITGASTPAITGVTTSNLINVSVHKRRMWIVEKNTLKAWYLSPDSVGGSATSLDLAGIADQGGYLMATGTWTLDGGSGPDDYWVGITSEGQIIVYQGTDPSSSSTWSLVGVWNVGHPIGRRCLIKYRGDLLIVCHDGIYPLSIALVNAQVDRRAAITDKIVEAINSASDLYENNFGWQILFFPEASMILLNVPVNEGSDQEQYVMNTITGAWARFTGIDANCWALSGNAAYFGGEQIVGSFWDSFSDNGTNIIGDIQQAFNYFKSPGQLKHWKMIQPVFQSNGTPSVFIGLNVDYNTEDPGDTLNFAPTGYAVWDDALWDAGIWGGGLSVLANWETVPGIGYCCGLRMNIEAAGIEIRFVAANYIFERGSLLG